MAKKPLYENVVCYGKDLRTVQTHRQIDLSYLIDFYTRSPKKESFFIPFFTKLAGTNTLQQQITSGLSEREIRVTWQKGLEDFKGKRVKYLLYPDFE